MIASKLIRVLTILIVTGAFAGVSKAQQSQTSTEMGKAAQMINAKKWAEAVEALDALVLSEPNNARALFMLGYAHHSAGNFEKAISAYEKNIPISKNPTAMYNLACSYAKLDKIDKSFEWLEKAINVGLPPAIDLSKDEDLATLRSDIRFAKMVDLVERTAKPCLHLAEARQFDYWLGEWEVFPYQAPLGRAPKVGDSKIERISEGCGLLENWSSPGENGKSINYYDSSTGKWYQHWIGSKGAALRYEGAFRDGAIRFEGALSTKDGKRTINRLTFFKLDDGAVRQFAETSSDDGKTWNPSYDFRYVRKVSSAAIAAGSASGGALGAFGAVASIQTGSILLPRGEPIEADGLITDKEWATASVHKLGDGGLIRLNQSGEYLQIALQGKAPGLAHLYLFDGVDVHVLHASAALGSSVYKKDGEVWQPSRKFDWELRGQAGNREASASFLKTNNWLASLPLNPTAEREFKVAMSLFKGSAVRLAAVYVDGTNTLRVFPRRLIDDTLRRELLFGSEPNGLKFQTDNWVLIQTKDK